MMRRLAALILALLIALPLQAQDGPATLIADRVEVTPDGRLIAQGAVEVFYRGARLRASRVAYDRRGEQVTIEGPLVLTEGADTILLADSAELAADLREGILLGARLVLDQQLQIAAASIRRDSGRYTRMSRSVASSCEVCADNPTPIWEIRAREVMHDQLERQIYFSDAQFRILGVPVFYTPYLRMPDPTLDRATGFLFPTFRTTSTLGPGIRVPYFIRLGDSADLTVAPYLSTGRTTTLDLRYRQAFRRGTVEFEGAISRDDLRPGETRGYLFGGGRFALGGGYRLDFGIEAVSDPAYVQDYGLESRDRLVSFVEISRTRRNEFVSVRTRAFHSIRDGEINSQLPNLVTDATLHRRFGATPLGGAGGLKLQVHTHRRSSSLDILGRDMARATAEADWRRNWSFDNGVLAGVMTQVAADYYVIRQDSTYPGGTGRLTPTLAAELRWPLLRTDPGGVAHVIEPMVQIARGPRSLRRVPNEDSVLVEFDESNLFALNRFPGTDRREIGLRANVGVSYTRHDPAGWSMGATVGRVYRRTDVNAFTDSTGLDGSRSDWLAAVHLNMAAGLRLSNRTLIDDTGSATRSETQIAWATNRLDLATGYIWLEPDSDPDVNRNFSTSEWAVDASYRLTDNWTGRAAGRFDFNADRATSAALGLSYVNECITVDLSLSRRFTSSTSVRPVTDFGLSVDLAGFGRGDGSRPPRRSCAR